jgi:hypothetical protein
MSWAEGAVDIVLSGFNEKNLKFFEIFFYKVFESI